MLATLLPRPSHLSVTENIHEIGVPLYDRNNIEAKRHELRVLCE